MAIDDHSELRLNLKAVLWHMRLESEGWLCVPQLTAWLLESVHHAQAYLHVGRMMERLDHIDPRREIDVDALIREAKASSVIDLCSRILERMSRE